MNESLYFLPHLHKLKTYESPLQRISTDRSFSREYPPLKDNCPKHSTSNTPRKNKKLDLDSKRLRFHKPQPVRIMNDNEYGLMKRNIKLPTQFKINRTLMVKKAQLNLNQNLDPNSKHPSPFKILFRSKETNNYKQPRQIKKQNDFEILISDELQLSDWQSGNAQDESEQFESYVQSRHKIDL